MAAMMSSKRLQKELVKVISTYTSSPTNTSAVH
jgi:hypothetical protein